MAAPERRKARARSGRLGRERYLTLALIALGVVLGLLAAVNLAMSLTGSEEAEVRVAAESPVVVGRVANTDGIGVYLRGSPSMADLLHAIPEGTTLKLVGGETRAEGIAWRQVEEPGGARGWVPSQYVRLEP